MSKHILLAEDEQETRNTFRAILENSGYEVTVVADGTDALQYLKGDVPWSKKVDLLITDVVMRGLNGLQLLDEIKALDIKVPILVLTGYGDEKLIAELTRRGCGDFIEKPFEAATLVSKIETVLASASC
jgi:two-component system nitrogen regulation response regulator NtrX